MVGCQVPSCWEVILPAWSFMWHYGIWEYYFFTGDQAYLEKSWPAVLKNLNAAKEGIDERGLYNVPYWNFFDWTPIDSDQDCVTHNSMFLVGAIDSALKTAAVIGKNEDVGWLSLWRVELVDALLEFWNDEMQAWPDSIHRDGEISRSKSQHTSFLAVLYDILTGDIADAVKRNVLNPPADMVKVGSPFAMQYLLEAYEMLGENDKVVESIRANYQVMIEEGSTTVWENFPGSFEDATFATRSHAHAWSSCPVYFLNRIVLGIKQVAVGGAKFEISPWVSDLEWANGASASMMGPVKVRWKKQDGQKEQVAGT